MNRPEATRRFGLLLPRERRDAEMRSRRSSAHPVATASVLFQIAAYLLWRPRMLRWGATD